MAKKSTSKKNKKITGIQWLGFVKVMFVSILWLGLLLLTFYTLFTIPALVLVTWWLVVVIRQIKIHRDEQQTYDSN